MSELPKLHHVEPSKPVERLLTTFHALPKPPRTSMRESDFAGFTPEGRETLARILRRAIERNRAVKP